nr:hypothetical protein [Candidatus Sigynarchaeota archaeon]
MHDDDCSCPLCRAERAAKYGFFTSDPDSSRQIQRATDEINRIHGTNFSPRELAEKIERGELSAFDETADSGFGFGPGWSQHTGGHGVQGLRVRGSTMTSRSSVDDAFTPRHETSFPRPTSRSSSSSGSCEGASCCITLIIVIAVAAIIFGMA